MIFTYRPEGADPKSWEFRPEKLLNAECIEIEKRTGWDYNQWIERFRSGNMTAITAFVFVMLRRTHHQLKWDDVRFTLDEVSLEPSPDEMAEARRIIEDTPEDERTPEMWDALRELDAAGVESAPAGDVDDPKD